MEIKRIIIWGLRYKYHTHKHIHSAFYKNAKKLGYDTEWFEDLEKNRGKIKRGDLIIYADPVGKMIPEKTRLSDYNIPIRDDVYYCLHNVNDIFKNELKPRNYVNLQVFSDYINDIKPIEKWGPVTYFDKTSKTLYQPWGTDLLENEFKKPVFNRNKLVFWIGSIWNDALNRGNLNEISELKKALKEEKLFFINIRFIPDFLNIFLVRLSRIAPAISGKFQTEINYLPCRMFKNISYGQLGITNVSKFKEILGDSYVEGDNMKELITNAISLTKDEYIAKISKQQEIVKSYTYKQSIENIISAMKIINNEK